MTHGLSKTWAALIIAVLALSIGQPGLMYIIGKDPPDSFPISDYNMFANPRPRLHEMSYIRGRKGDEWMATPATVWSAGGMNPALAKLKRLRRKDAKNRERRCTSFARRVVKRRRYRKVEELEIVRAHFIPRKVFEENIMTPQRERILARCLTPYGKRMKRRRSRRQTPPEFQSAPAPSDEATGTPASRERQQP
ncbi:MAG: hypothetical protein V3V08_03395 [Nannocystaceae bacterium]